MSTDSSQAQRKPLGPHKPAPLPPVVGHEAVIVACGHEAQFPLFEDKRDRYRDLRRKKLQERPCKACREKRLQEEQAAAQARKDQRQQGRSSSRRQPPGRLPDGAQFEVTYDAARTCWSGKLTVGEQVFTDQAGAVFTLMSRLDDKYRRSLPAAPPAAG